MNRRTREPIDQEWIGKYVQHLLEAAKELPEGKFRDAVMINADNVINLVEAWRKRQ